ncbi:MAG: CPBP family intramembrane glutamic endopeptidase [Rhodospirillaceae bacterium]|nr:CPBP family intramembrane glutamic endopeptidase [Rhodospirillaceae bacterium]
MTGELKLKPIVAFIGLACLIGWVLFGWAYSASGKIDQWALLGLQVGPLLAALITAKWIDQGPVWARLGCTRRINKWFLVAWLLPILVIALATFSSVGMPGVDFIPWTQGYLAIAGENLPPNAVEAISKSQTPYWQVLLRAATIGAVMFSIGGLLEEVGWRGYLWQLMRPRGFLFASFSIGLIWGLWHAPLIVAGWVYPGYPILGVVLFTLACVLLGPLFGLIREKSGSVFAAALTHGTLNSFAGVSLYVLSGNSPFTKGLFGLMGFVVMSMCAAYVAAFYLPKDAGSETTQLDQANFKRYNLEIVWASIVYGVSLFAWIAGYRFIEPGFFRALSAAIPTAGASLFLLAMYRHYRRVDERRQRLMLEIIAWAAGATVISAMGYTFLEIGSKLPKLSMTVVVVAMGTYSWVVSMIYGLRGHGNPFWR